MSINIYLNRLFFVGGSISSKISSSYSSSSLYSFLIVTRVDSLSSSFSFLIPGCVDSSLQIL